MVSTTRSATWRSDDSRSGVPSVPRKYFWARMLVALSDHVTGTSTPSCSKATVPSLWFVMRASLRSQVTSSYGCTPSVVKNLLIPMPVRSGAIAILRPSFCCVSAQLRVRRGRRRPPSPVHPRPQRPPQDGVVRFARLPDEPQDVRALHQCSYVPVNALRARYD